MFQYLRSLFFGLIFLIPVTSFAAVPSWQIVPGESSVNFKGTMNGAPVSGQFKSFSGDINFDPAKLNESKVHMVIDLASVNTSYGDIAETLKMPEWFNVKAFPQAIFEATKFTKTGDKTYKAEGTLTIRNKTIPVTLDLTQEDYSNNKAKVSGTTKLKRLAFGIGTGEWASTDAVKDDVDVNFVITATKK